MPKPYTRAVFNQIVAAIDTPVPMPSGGVRARAEEETFFGQMGIVMADGLKRKQLDKVLTHRRRYINDEGIWQRPPRARASEDRNMADWRPMGYVGLEGDDMPLLPFPFDAIDLAHFMQRGLASVYLTQAIQASIFDAGGDVAGGLKLFLPAPPEGAARVLASRQAVAGAWEAITRACSSLGMCTGAGLEKSARDRAFGADVSRALEKLRPAISVDAPAVEVQASTAAAALPEPTAPRPVQHQYSQEVAILAALRELGHEPLCLPAPPTGKACPVKAAVRARCADMTKAVFAKAWQRLRTDGSIRNG